MYFFYRLITSFVIKLKNYFFNKKELQLLGDGTLSATGNKSCIRSEYYS